MRSVTLEWYPFMAGVEHQPRLTLAEFYLLATIRKHELFVRLPPAITNQWMAILSDGDIMHRLRNPGEVLTLIFYGCLELKDAGSEENGELDTFRLSPKGRDYIDFFLVR